MAAALEERGPRAVRGGSVSRASARAQRAIISAALNTLRVAIEFYAHPAEVTMTPNSMHLPARHSEALTKRKHIPPAHPSVLNGTSRHQRKPPETRARAEQRRARETHTEP
eukprot:1522482-Pyramimonas_sp.AAC.1